MIAIWFRADLRTVDQPALSAACALAHETNQGVVALYIVSSKQWRSHEIGDARIDFERRSLVELAKELQTINIPLKIIDCPWFASIPEQLRVFCEQFAVKHVFANRQYEWNEVVRDRACHRELKKINIAIEWSHDQCLIAPDVLKTKDGRFYTVFTPFKKNALSYLSAIPPQVLPPPKPIQSLTTLNSDPIPADFGDYNSMPHLHDAWPAGESAALEQLNDFCEADISNYKINRDFPQRAGTSKLAAHLAVGSISARQCWQAAQHAMTSGSTHGDVEQWLSELIWRDFYRHVMVGFPRVSRGQPFKLDTLRIDWRYDETEFAAWCAGQTGFPIVDAAMRCLNATGWMHNRLRMIVSMFLVKDLLIDWRWGERYFANTLIDFDLASNNGGWQWSASTGNDAVPYFRIFNPLLQSQKFDPDGAFIRQWIPELRECSSKQIHQPLPFDAPDYPQPIVNHAFARERTLAAFKTAKS